MHLSIGNKRAAAECYYIVKDYEKALALFLDIGEIMSAIECCDLLEDVGRVLSIVELFKSKMSLRVRDALLRKYAPIALEELVQNVGLSALEIQTKNETTEEGKIIKKKQKVIDLIQEEGDEEEEEEEEPLEDDGHDGSAGVAADDDRDDDIDDNLAVNVNNNEKI